jgi:transporter family protein
MSWVIYAFLAALTAALVAILSKIGIKDVDPVAATTVRGLAIALTMGIAGTFLGKWKGIGDVDGRTWLILAGVGAIGGLSWFFGFIALKAGGSAIAVSAIDRLSVIFVVVLAALVLGERITWASGVGAILVGVGVFLMTVPIEQITKLLGR